MRDFSEALADLRRRVVDAHGYLRVDECRARLVELESVAADPELWNDQDRARAVTQELARVRADVEVVDGLDGQVSDLETLHELAREEGDESLESEIEAGASTLSVELDRQRRGAEIGRAHV